MLILPQLIKVKVDKRTKSYYIDKHYEVPLNGHFYCSADDLHPNCLSTVKVECDYCGNLIEKTFRNYLRQNIQGRIKKDACDKCKSIKTKESLLLSNSDQHSIVASQTKEYRKNQSIILRYKNKYGIELDKEKLLYSYSPTQWWKWTYYGSPNGKKLISIPQEIFTEENVDSIFRYVLENEIKYTERNDFLRLSTKILKKYRINFFKFYCQLSPIFILKKLYPDFQFHEFELENTPLNYWNDKNNADDALRYYVDNEVIPNISDIKNELPSYFTFSNIRNSSFKSLAYVISKHYSSFFEWVNALYPQFSLTEKDFNDVLAFDGTKLNSNEEKIVYELLKKDLRFNCQSVGLNKKYKFRDEQNNANYIPDFLINDNVIVEYFGLFREKFGNSRILKDYYYKTLRKIDFYSNLNNYIFISIFPNELSDIPKLKSKIINLLN
jgi:hypothetical protein